MLEDTKQMKETGKKLVEQVGEVIKQSNDKVTKIVKASPSSASITTLPVETKLTKEELATLDYSTYDTPARMLALGEVLAKSNLVPLNKAADVAVALMTGKELGLPFITSVSQIYPINGRPTLGVHIQKALLLKAGVVFEKIEDAVPLYNFVKVVGDKIEQLGKGTLEEQPKDSKKKQIDTRTTYKFTREIKMPSGKWKEITAKGSFSISEATDAGLIEKDVWVKYWRRMLDARAFTNGAREIADDIILGIYSPNELSDSYYVNDEGQEIHTVEIV